MCMHSKTAWKVYSREKGVSLRDPSISPFISFFFFFFLLTFTSEIATRSLFWRVLKNTKHTPLSPTRRGELTSPFQTYATLEREFSDLPNRVIYVSITCRYRNFGMFQRFNRIWYRGVERPLQQLSVYYPDSVIVKSAAVLELHCCTVRGTISKWYKHTNIVSADFE